MDLTLYDLEERQAKSRCPESTTKCRSALIQTTRAARPNSAPAATCCVAAMEKQGFTVYESEWWHFDYRDWPHYAIGNVPFEDVR